MLDLIAMKKLTPGLLLLFMLAGCANYGTPKNIEIPDPREAEIYSLYDWRKAHSDNDIRFILTFSGGGTRAAALSYGVMQELRETNINYEGRPQRLLDEVDYISSVSGGSFTSAYYGLHGDGIFESYEEEFLKFNLQKHLALRALNPFLWFSKNGRTESAIKYYQKFLFHDATFADMIRPDRPMIIINTSDLAYGIRFSFIQEYFDLLCSELSAYPVADAVAASSAVPVLFNPVVVANYDTCSDMQLLGTTRLHSTAEMYGGQNLPVLLSQLETYGQKDKRKFVHFVDGGITDNLGLRAVSDILAISGGPELVIERNEKPPRHVVVLMVNAATETNEDMDLSNKEPSAFGVVGAVTNLQLSRYDTDSMLLNREVVEKWATELSTPEQAVKTHFINVSIQKIKHPEALEFFNAIPTSFALRDEQVDKLIEVGRKLLRDDPGFQQLLVDLNNE
ncbi:MAG: patatin-like phospholipase family protein [Desulfuromonadales bacterium]|nr:patatin-like phospholipase family protein [Xanthomonadales bacterium]MDH4026029.1 patatin-like phospholipase family protein [Desulfuromonadales bacterium]